MVTIVEQIQQNFHGKIFVKIFCPCFYCLKSYAELKHDIFKQQHSFFWMVIIIEQFFAMEILLSENILTHCFLSEIFPELHSEIFWR